MADVLVERLNRLFLHGTMSTAARKTIVNAVNKLAPTEALRRVKLAVQSDSDLDRLSGAKMKPMMHSRTLDLTSPQRRQLLKFAAASGLLAAVERNVAMAQAAPDYKALVCIFQQGGNDGENTLIRHDTAGYQAYAAIRTPASGIHIPQSQLVPIQPAPQLPALWLPIRRARGLKTLFDQKKLAVIANVGILTQPCTDPGLETGG